MTRPRRANPVTVALYVNAVLLAGVLIVLLGRDTTLSLTPAALAQQQPPIAGGAGVFIMPAQFSSNVWGVYLLDVDQQTMCAYTVTGSPQQLKLIAARNFRNDRKLGNYNTGVPTPAEVKELVEKEQQSAK